MKREKTTKRPRRKAVLFLVEGASEKIALWEPFSILYKKADENIKVYVSSMEKGDTLGGDITADRNVSPDDIHKKLYSCFIQKFLEVEHLYPKEIEEIIHIVDLDGAYINDAAIIETKSGSDGKATFYYDDHIETANVAGIIERNDRKRKNIDRLCSMNSIVIKQKEINYSVYYFSSNLDHFLHNDANLANREKTIKASNFADACLKNENYFVRFFCSSGNPTAGMTYEESWEFAKQGGHSLERGTNINLLINKLRREE